MSAGATEASREADVDQNQLECRAVDPDAQQDDAHEVFTLWALLGSNQRPLPLAALWRRLDPMTFPCFSGAASAKRDHPSSISVVGSGRRVVGSCDHKKHPLICAFACCGRHGRQFLI